MKKKPSRGQYKKTVNPQTGETERVRRTLEERRRVASQLARSVKAQEWGGTRRRLHSKNFSSLEASYSLSGRV